MRAHSLLPALVVFLALPGRAAGEALLLLPPRRLPPTMTTAAQHTDDPPLTAVAVDAVPHAPSSSSSSSSSFAASSWYTGARTGITTPYLEACARALASPPRSLSRYKRDPSIVFVADPVSPLCAKKCIRLLLRHADPSVVRRALARGGPMDALDSVGHPRTYDFGGAFGVRHPLSVRSLWHAADILRQFAGTRGARHGARPAAAAAAGAAAAGAAAAADDGDLAMRGWRIAEIGAGAICGVSRLLLDLMPQVATYDIFELPTVGKLCQRATHGGGDAGGRLRFFRGAAGGAGGAAAAAAAAAAAGGGGAWAGPSGEEEGEPYDLVLSTFSLSELDLSTQRLYGVRLLAPAKRLYIATNAPPGGNMFGEGVAEGSEFVPAREFSGGGGSGGGAQPFVRGPFLRRLLRDAHPALETRPGYLPGANEVWVSGGQGFAQYRGGAREGGEEEEEE
jgi:hypothetical protein